MTYKRLLKLLLDEVMGTLNYRVRKHISRPQKVKLNGLELTITKRFSPRVVDEIYRKRYEAREARLLLSRIAPDDVVMDFGAGVGYTAMLCARAIGVDRVFCYEGNPALASIIAHHFETNCVHPTFQNVLLGRQNGETVFFVAEELFSSSTTNRSEGAQAVCVKVLDINEEIEKRKPTFLIIDIEGGEYELISYINFKNIKKVLIELHHNILDPEQINKVRAQLTHEGFTVDSAISDKGVVYLEKLT